MMFNLTTTHGPAQALDVRVHDGTGSATAVAKLAIDADAICFNAPMSVDVVAALLKQPVGAQKVVTAVMSHDTGGVNGKGWTPAAWAAFCGREDVLCGTCVERDVTSLVEFRASIPSSTGVGLSLIHI